MPTVREAFAKFLELEQPTHNGPDLLARFLSGPIADMEVQINVSSAGGERVDGKNNTYTNGSYDWWNVRWPKKADSGGEWRDYELKWPPELHASDIGVTGWNWVNKESVAVGFDFDAITGHAKGVGVSDEELDRVKAAAQAIPWVEVRRSTSGKGLHLWVFLEKGVKTENHTIHAALARAILGLMSAEANFDFASQIDACGSVLWIWSRRATPENQGFALIKQATEVLTLSKLPANWRDHVAVVTRRRDKVRVEGVGDDVLDPFEALASARRKVPLDAKHKAIVEALAGTGYTTCWVADHHLLQTKTTAFKLLMDDPQIKRELGLQGFFNTISEGKNKGKPNCFAFPMENGGWKLFRFPGPGVPEHETWAQDKEGWTTCDFNCRPNLKSAALALGGVEDADRKGGFVFQTADKAVEAAEVLGQKIVLPEPMRGRQARLGRHRDGRLVVDVEKKEGDEGMSGWLPKKTNWSRIFNVQTEHKQEEQIGDYDNLCRALVTMVGERVGWATKSSQSTWDRVPKGDVKNVLLHKGKTKDEADAIMGGAIIHRWKLVNLPFQSEYPGGRQWNPDAPQFRYQPSEDHESVHPTWDVILDHCGQELNLPLRELEWAQRANIKTGRDYLLAWIACLLREPFERLPYLFFYGEQNSGKTTLHKAIKLLMTGGVGDGKFALTNPNGFNGEVANCVLVFIEETDISEAKGAYNRIKQWVTDDTIVIHIKGRTPYSQPNFIHIIQTANHRSHCAIEPRDTRITMAQVPNFRPGQEIRPDVLFSRLEQEAPAFMRTLMGLVLPPKTGRLRLPEVSTYSKERAEDANCDPVEAFLAEACYHVPGALIKFDEFYEKFKQSPLSEEVKGWSKPRLVKGLPQWVTYGSYTNNVRYLGNLSWEPAKGESNDKMFVSIDRRLRLKEGN